jgi:hypothetical protein
MIALSLDSYSQFLSESKLSTNTEWTKMVKSVGNDIRVSVEEYMNSTNLND